MTTDQEVLLSEAESLSPARSRSFISDAPFGPIEYRDSGIKPLHVSSYTGAHRLRAEFIRGCEALGLNTDRKPIHPQQFVLADTINASDDDGPLFSTIGVCWPRRASKTTTLFAIAMGRCLSRPGYIVAYSAQRGNKARARFLRDLVDPLEAQFKKEEMPFHIIKSAGGEYIKFHNGSLFAILPPLPPSFRGDSYDMVLLDESQEYDEELSANLLVAILPTFDTRPGAQLIVAGTAGEERVGLLWDTLEAGRNGAPGTGICEYAAPADTPDFDPDDPESTMEGSTSDPAVWASAHPGVGNLTPAEIVKKNFSLIDLAAFKRDYLGMWPTGSNAAFISAVNYDLCRLDEPAADVKLPKVFALSFGVHPAMRSASVVAAWRVDGVAQILVLEHRSGVEWLHNEVLGISRKYNVPIVHETIGAALAEAEHLGRAYGNGQRKPKLLPQKTAQISTAAALFVNEINAANLRHWNQDALNMAVAVATKRGQPDSRWWYFGSLTPEGDITALNAAAMALRSYDDTKPKRTFIPKSMRPAEEATE